MDSGRRPFILLVGSVLTLRAVLAASAYCLVHLIAVRVADAGPAVLWSDGQYLPAVLAAALLAASTVATARRAFQSRRDDRALRAAVRGRSRPADGGLAAVAARHGLADRVVVVDEPRPYAFTFGMLRPRVAVSRSLLDNLEPGEVAAVLAHEAAHVRGRDPLKTLLARLATSRGLYLPPLRDLSARFTRGRELAADRSAVAACGVRPVVGALLRSATPPAWRRDRPRRWPLKAPASRWTPGSASWSPASNPRPAAPIHSTAVGAASATVVAAIGVQAYILMMQLCGCAM
ncbi:M56 family metallopeptidase [Nocardiopsis gilva]|uniref:M56 family metallopeptidase n=1 Tax=Nocardiopsis gilva TaxID=280236 RepID=UPI0012FE3BE3|nr:M56 family metallopeptidase [Nocardiopsis gilva]